MLACVLREPGPVGNNRLTVEQIPVPEPGPGQVLVRVKACGVCRTDLHVVEGELPQKLAPVIPGHQVAGVVERHGPGQSVYPVGTRVGVAWLHSTCGSCRFCHSGSENLCADAQFTGWSVNGGFAEYMLASEDFMYPLPDSFSDLQAAPLLCAGIIGFRCLRVSGIGKGGRLGLYGFGAAAHVAIQVARHWDVEVYVATRDQRHRKLAAELGATWAGDSFDAPPAELDAAIIFAPAGELVPPALSALRKGGVVVLGGIYMSPIPELPYELIYQERAIRSVANNTRADGTEFLRVASEIPIVPRVEAFPLRDANMVLQKLKNDGIRGGAVLQVDAASQKE
jgi:propanol-preferring alcohol dehydrogenase